MFISNFSHVRLSLDNKRLLAYLLTYLHRPMQCMTRLLVSKKGPSLQGACKPPQALWLVTLVSANEVSAAQARQGSTQGSTRKIRADQSRAPLIIVLEFQFQLPAKFGYSSGTSVSVWFFVVNVM